MHSTKWPAESGARTFQKKKCHFKKKRCQWTQANREQTCLCKSKKSPWMLQDDLEVYWACRTKNHQHLQKFYVSHVSTCLNPFPFVVSSPGFYLTFLSQTLLLLAPPLSTPVKFVMEKLHKTKLHVFVGQSPQAVHLCCYGQRERTTSWKWWEAKFSKNYKSIWCGLAGSRDEHTHGMMLT